jgi:cytochrome c2
MRAMSLAWNTAPPCPRPALTAGFALAGAIAGLALGGCELRERPLPHAGAPKEHIARGQQLLSRYQCGSCHAIPGVAGAIDPVGPPLSAYGRRSYIAGRVPNHPESLAQWIVHPASLVPDTAMPSMGVSAMDARDMAAYLLALR